MDIQGYENDIYKIPSQVKFKQKMNEHQKKLAEIVKKIYQTDEVIVSADKTGNFYKMKREDYLEHRREAVAKDYKKTTRQVIDQVNIETAHIATELDLDKRMERYRETECFFTLKDHKKGWPSKISKRLLNGAKTELGKVSKIMLQGILEKVLKETGLSSWQSTRDCLEWFKGLPQDQELSFLCYDIESFYPSITEEMLEKALDFAESIVTITAKEKEIIKLARKSFLFLEGQPYIKKNSNGSLFDVAQGSFDSAQICELVGIVLLSEISKIIPKGFHGLYRDDGLIVLPAHGKTHEEMRQKLVKIFGENNFKLDTLVNVKNVEFLDTRLDLETRTFRPYHKPNSITKYVHIQSNHSPGTKKAIPLMIEKRISYLSSNGEIFDEEKDHYQNSLNESGYKHKLTFQGHQSKEKKRCRSRRVIWFNPPWNDSVVTPVGKLFMRAIDRWFPKGHPLSKIFNHNTLKISYSTTRNLAAHISAHNRKILSPNKMEKPGCNCQKRNKDKCPLQGKCTVKLVCYQADVLSPGELTKTYYGHTIDFKQRYRQHTTAINIEHSSQKTELSNYIWQLKNAGKEWEIKWSVKGRAPIYTSGSKCCNLCIKEKTAICLHDPRTLLNSRTELLGKCSHKGDLELRYCLKPRHPKKKKPPQPP